MCRMVFRIPAIRLEPGDRDTSVRSALDRARPGIMAALGNVYGVFVEMLEGTIGFAGAGVTGYALARFIGKRTLKLVVWN